ncbi:hypothetical protein [Marinobacterium rhizophilum]|uniref:DUF2314 domain-containing protein n=1 Tax=Marinobacterium rhizophilum TaxID=420402 RepID=A0ABY5HMH0_9GAMM|nr:hypothetical protein [Marinobacterium rhizophilum]UTW13588.1 hypothetical protein KDW95_08100 [Marinobacterium rhizophilum]
MTATPPQTPLQTTPGTRTLLMLLLAACLLASALLLPRLLASSQPPDLITEPGCDLSAGPCSSRAAEQSMTLALSSGPAQAGSTVQFSLQLKAVPAQAVWLQLEGRDMYMGINRIPLEKSADSPGLWHGTTELAICTTELMQWQVRVEATAAATPITALFEFSSQ